MSESFRTLVEETLGPVANAEGMRFLAFDQTPLYAYVRYAGNGRVMDVAEEVREGYLSVMIGWEEDLDASMPTGVTVRFHARGISVEMLMSKEEFRQVPMGYYTLRKPGKRREALAAYARFIERKRETIFGLPPRSSKTS
jgi:hypothetical protein